MHGFHISKRFAEYLFAITIIFLSSLVVTQALYAPTISVDTSSALVQPPGEVSHHVAIQNVRGIYLTGWTAGSLPTILRILHRVEPAHINALVIDIKDASGRLSYIPKDPKLVEVGSGQKRISDVSHLIEELHEQNLYVIGRIVVFEDPFFAKLHPEAAFQNNATGTIWSNFQGTPWLRPDSKVVWDYISAIAQDAYAEGFDEINLDYVRFPSDGDLSVIDRGSREARIAKLDSFFAYMNDEVREKGIPLSADLFGLTVSAEDDIGIGQLLTHVAPYVDYVCPMIYPSHFAPGSYGYAMPAAEPYGVIHRALSDGIHKLEAIGMSQVEAQGKLRPWIQDFNLVGVKYSTREVQAEVEAAQDLGFSSWLFWDPKNTYVELSQWGGVI